MNESNQIEALLKDASEESAAKLQEIADSATDKETVKAAKRALYLLSQKHILPPKRSPRQTDEIENQKSKIENHDGLRAFASAYDGTGNRMLIFLVPQADGGNPLLTYIVVGDEIGVQNYRGEITPRREVQTKIENIHKGLEHGVAFAEIEGDYGRFLLAEAHALNQQQKTMTPNGFLDLLPQIGSPHREYEQAPIYDEWPPEEVSADQTISHNPQTLFERVWFEAWFLDVEETIPWLARFAQAMESPIELPESAKAERKEKVLKEATEALLPDKARALYVRRLEESADILRRRGETETARMALYHALQLAEEKPVSEVSFARFLVERSWSAAYYVLRQETERREAARERSGIVTPGSGY